MSIKIDWRNIKKTSNGDRNEFEHFCGHVFLRNFGEMGIYERCYNTPGSESYIVVKASTRYNGIELNAGDVIGWQAKFWLGTNDDTFTPVNSKRVEELKKCFETTVQHKPNIKIWIVCTPGQLHEKTWKSLQQKLGTVKSDCTLISWHKDVFEHFYINDLNKYNGIFHYYFSGQFLEINIINSITNDTLETLKKKYDVDLHVPSEVEHSLLAVIDSNIGNKLLKTRLRNVVEEVQNDMKKNVFFGTHCYSNLPENFIDLCNNEIQHRFDFANQLAKYTECDNVADNVIDIADMLHQYYEDRQVLIEKINNHIQQLFEIPNNNISITQWELRVIKERIVKLEELISGLPKETLSLRQVIALITEKVHAIFAEPGYGKTHLACSIANSLLSRNQPVLLLMGTKFRVDKEIRDILIDMLHLQATATLDDVFDILDFIGECKKCKLPIIIDGLNESSPRDDRWREDLPLLQRRVNTRKNLLLITTCRSQVDYLQTIYSCNKISEIPCSYELGGLVFYNMEKAVSKYFNKYDIIPNSNPRLEEFANPLLLKMFCEVNKGKRNFDLHGTSLTNCMQAYSEHMIENIVKTSKSKLTKKYQIEKELNDLARMIWENNLRQVNFSDFIKVFSSEDDVHILLDEGCFSIEGHGIDMCVQFSYDMIAGYYIAKNILNANSTKDSLREYINSHIEHLYGAERHTYAQDIIKNLLCLIPQKYGLQWWQLMPTKEIISSTIENIDYFLSDGSDAKLLDRLIEQCLTSSLLKKKLCERLYKRICVERNLSNFSCFIPFFEKLTPSEIDQYWNNCFIEYTVLNQIEDLLHDEFTINKYSYIDVVTCNIMLCGVVVSSYKERYHTLLFFYILQHYNNGILAILRKGLQISDYAIFESIVSILLGVAIRKENLEYTNNIIDILEEYLHDYSSNCILLLDALETLYSFVENKWGKIYDRTILSKNQSEDWPIADCRESDLFGLYDYDFEKFNIRPLYEKHYYASAMKTPYSQKDINGMLLNRCIRNGYDQDVCTQLNNQLIDVKYRSVPELNYGYKYGRFALMELYGWLILNGVIEPMYGNNFRVELFDIDPTMPIFRTKSNFITRSFMPNSVDYLSEWLEYDNTQSMEDLFIRTLPKQEGEWILLQGRLTQKMTDRYAHYYISGHAELASKLLSDDIIQALPIVESRTLNHIYAGELGWRILEDNDMLTEENDNIGMLDYYAFTSWSGSRYKYMSFEYLRAELAEKLCLQFDVNTMTYYDADFKTAAVYFVNDTDLFFYLRKDIVDRLLELTESALRFHIYERCMISHEIPKEKDKFLKKFEQRERDVIYRI
jgi:hypothetical protein